MTETTNTAARLRDAISDARRGHRLHEYEGAAHRLAAAAETFLDETERRTLSPRHVPGCALADHRAYGMPGDEPLCTCGASAAHAFGYRPPTSTRLVVEIDADNLREQIRGLVVEILAERDQAVEELVELRLAATSVVRRMREATAGALYPERPEPADRSDLLSALADELEEAIAVSDDDPSPAATCACPDGAVDGHVCEATS